MTALFFRGNQNGWITIQSQVPGRVRFRVPSLKDNPTLKQSLEWALSRRVGLYAYSVSTVTGSILVHHRDSVQATELLGALTGIVLERCGLGEAAPAWGMRRA